MTRTSDNPGIVPPRELVIQRALLWAGARGAFLSLPPNDPQTRDVLGVLADCEDRLYRAVLALAYPDDHGVTRR